MQHSNISVQEAKQMDMINFLSQAGHRPQKINGPDYWYLSPLRQEKTASFKVNTRLNAWYDHGIGKGGNLIDFGILYFNCSVKEFLQHLAGQKLLIPSFFQPPVLNNYLRAATHHLTDEKKDNPQSKINVLESRPLQQKILIKYLDTRCIDLAIAKQFCREVDFELYGKKRTAIGFENNGGGYELRSPDFKGSSSPKTTTFFNQEKNELTVFEGFFNFLSYQTIATDQTLPLTNFLVLNSLSFFQKEQSNMEKHDRIHLYLDNDTAGKKHTQIALQWSEKYVDQSHHYRQYKDLNQKLVQQPGMSQRQSLRRGKHF
jgi:hypothetical protein